VRLEPVTADEAARIVAGDLGDRAGAPGWPHEDTAAGLSFTATGGTSFLVIDDDERIAGECGTKRPPDAAGMVEIGYGLAAPSRGRGLGTRAVAALVKEISTWPDVTVVEAEVHVSNTASRRLIERLGFVVVGDPQDSYLRFRRESSLSAS